MYFLLVVELYLYNTLWCRLFLHNDVAWRKSTDPRFSVFGLQSMYIAVLILLQKNQKFRNLEKPHCKKNLSQYFCHVLQ